MLAAGEVEQLVRKGEGPQKIVVLNVKGVLFSGGAGIFGPEPLVPMLRRHLKRIRSDENVVAVVLDMNTPGGEVTATDELHHAIQQSV